LREFTDLINKVFRLTWFPLVFQLLTFMAFIMMIVGGLLANTGDTAW